VRSKRLVWLSMVGAVVVLATVMGAASDARAGAASTVTVGCDPSALISDLLSAYDSPGTTETLSLAAGCTYVIPAPPAAPTAGIPDVTPFWWYGPDGLPAIDGTITIDGNGATLSRDASAAKFRFFYVGADPASANTAGYTSPGAGTLTLQDLTLSGGLAQGGNASDAGGGAGMGGAVFNQGTLTLHSVTATGDVAQGGTGFLNGGDFTGGGGIGTDGSFQSSASNAAGGGFGPGNFGGPGGGTATGLGAGSTSGGGGGFAAGETGADATGAAGAGGGPQTGLGGVGGSSGAGGGDGSGGGSGPVGDTSGPGGAFGQGGSAGGGGGGVGGGGGSSNGGGGGFGAGGGIDGGSGGFGGGAGVAGAPGFGGGPWGAGSNGNDDAGAGAGMGGAIFNMQGSVTVVNSTLTANTAAGGAGGGASPQTAGEGLGGAIFNLNGAVMLTNDTVTANAAAQGGGGVYNLVYDSQTARTATTTIRDSILFGSASGVADLVSDKPAATVAAANLGTAGVDASGPNIVGADSQSGAGTVTGTPASGDPNLGLLQDNGGPGMETQLPAAPSPAIGAGTACAPADERGDARPLNGCDLGAAEVTSVGSPTASISSPASGATYAFGASVTASYACADPAGPGIASCDGTLASGAAIPTTSPGPHTFIVVATSADGLQADASSTYTVLARPSVPSSTSKPAVSGTAKAGSTLTCSPGTWANGPSTFTYTWSRNGTVLAGATSSTYKVQRLDEGSTITCTVTASNATGSGSAARSASFSIPVPVVARCPAATGTLHGRTLGLVSLGMTRAAARKTYRRSSNRGLAYQDFFCLTPIGIRVGYARAALVSSLPPRVRSQLVGRVVLALTANPRFAIDGIRPAATLTAAEKALPHGNLFHVGRNEWYLAPGRAATAVLKVRAGIVKEIGIGDRRLTTTPAQRRRFISSFGTAG